MNTITSAACVRQAAHFFSSDPTPIPLTSLLLRLPFEQPRMLFPARRRICKPILPNFFLFPPDIGLGAIYHTRQSSFLVSSLASSIALFDRRRVWFFKAVLWTFCFSALEVLPSGNIPRKSFIRSKTALRLTTDVLPG